MAKTQPLNVTNVRQYLKFFPLIANAFDMAGIRVKTNCHHPGENPKTDGWTEVYIPFQNFVQIQTIQFALDKMGEPWKVCVEGSGVDKIQKRTCLVVCVI